MHQSMKPPGPDDDRPMWVPPRYPTVPHPDTLQRTLQLLAGVWRWLRRAK